MCSSHRRSDASRPPAAARAREVSGESAEAAGRRARRLAALIAVVLVGLVAGCAGDDGEDADAPIRVGDPGPQHVHGLGLNPADDALFIATHSGLFRAGPGERRATRVGDRFQDTMGFTVVGPDRFLGSGHPDGRDGLPPFLGLIRSVDAGRSWKPVSLLGARDFHVLEAAGRRVYGFGSDFESRRQGLLGSEDHGRTWTALPAPEPLISLALAPRDPRRLIASGEQGLHSSEDGGRRWRPIPGPAGFVAWSRALVVVTFDGRVYASARPGVRPDHLGDIGGRAAALEAAGGGELYVALHDGTVKRSSDGGRSWRVRSRP